MAVTYRAASNSEMNAPKEGTRVNVPGDGEDGDYTKHWRVWKTGDASRPGTAITISLLPPGMVVPVVLTWGEAEVMAHGRAVDRINFDSMGITPDEVRAALLQWNEQEGYYPSLNPRLKQENSTRQTSLHYSWRCDTDKLTAAWGAGFEAGRQMEQTLQRLRGESQ